MPVLAASRVYGAGPTPRREHVPAKHARKAETPKSATRERREKKRTLSLSHSPPLPQRQQHPSPVDHVRVRQVFSGDLEHVFLPTSKSSKNRFVRYRTMCTESTLRERGRREERNHVAAKRAPASRVFGGDECVGDVHAWFDVSPAVPFPPLLVCGNLCSIRA